jgi:omega-amidase
MKISIVQADLAWEDKRSNLERLTRMLGALSGTTGLVILPEMFNTGFSYNVAGLAEEQGAETFQWMQEMAVSGNFAICGSFMVKENGRYFNRWLFADPGQNVHTYDKRHLFGPGGENRCFTAGTVRTVFAYREVRICPTVCYDLRFPVWSRNRNDYDLLINSANWPESRRDVWLTLLKARAIENQCYVSGANRVGVDGKGISYRGESVIYGPKGEVLTLAGQDTECVISAEIQMQDLKDFRLKFPVMNDADDFNINQLTS